jgi:hypothetical protein
MGNMSHQRNRQPLTKSQKTDSIFIGFALIALRLIGGLIGRDWAVGLSDVVIGIGVIGWSIWQR